MLDPLPQHPYEPGTRVHDVAETSVPAFSTGTADVIQAEPQRDGTFLYLVRTDRGGEEVYWPSYFTIAAGTWPGPPDSDPLFGPRPESDAADEEPAPVGAGRTAEYEESSPGRA